MQSEIPMGMLKEGTDDKLVLLASGGNSLATNALMARYQPFVLRIAKKMNAEHPDDAAHDILLKAVSNIQQFEHRSLFTTWLYRIAVNHILQLRKKSSIGLLRPGADFSVSEDNASSEKMQRYIEGMVGCLHPDQRITIVLSEHFGMDHQAAADILGITPSNFRKRLSRARKDLKNWANNQCSLLRQKSAQCHCEKKRKYFITQGWVDPVTHKFTKERLNDVHRLANVYCSLSATGVAHVTRPR